MTQTRISELADMICQHIVKGNTEKALLIAQALRGATGLKLRDVYRWKENQ